MTYAAAPVPDDRHHLSSGAGDPSSNSSDSESETDMGSKDDDVEYEEIEVEEEIEEEEEDMDEKEAEEGEEIDEKEAEDEEEAVEEEVDDGESLDSTIGGDHHDVSQDMASKGQEEHSRPGSSDPKLSVSNILSDTLAVEGGGGNLEFSSASEARQMGESCLDVDDLQYKCSGFQESFGDKKDLVTLPERRPPKVDQACNDINFSLCTSGIMTTETTEASSVYSKELDAAIRKEFSKGSSVVIESKKVVPLPQSMEYIDQQPTRLVVPQIRLRSLSHVAELENGKKRPAAICDFFAKGWCIKGNSCKFLHIKDHVNSTRQRPAGDVAALAEESELQAGRGVGDGTERSRSTDFPNATASAVTYSSSFLEKTLSGDHGGNPMWHHFAENQKILSLRRDELSHSNSCETSQLPVNNANGRASSMDSGRENVKQNWPAENIPIYRDNCFPEHKSLARNSLIRLDACTSLPSSGKVSSQNISGLSRSSFSFGSLDNNPLSAQKLSDPLREYRSSGSGSLLRSSSPFSGSDSGNVSLINVSGDPLRGHRSKISANDWEPSVPFRPSYLITQSLLSSGSLYDPIRDSIEQPNFGDSFSKFSSIRDTSIINSHPSLDSDPILKRTLGSEDVLNKESIVNHHTFSVNISDKNFERKNLFTTGGETMRTSDAEPKITSTLSEEEKLPGPSHLKDIAKERKTCFDYDHRNQEDGPRRNKQLKVDKSNNDMDIDLRRGGEEQKDSKALRYFRGALVDFVKELVKPKWHEGHLSKDAHKLIVKRAVEKVLSTLQIHQTPSTTESIKQYLTTSEPKISKLVEGYIVKYAKS